ncbi:hypothetical protein [Caminibacter mediatlanticus]|uniref:Uncharacterized protein n=1 Tax=Caminibacter mediatlanticus TB-2 TaxID=391592 RepID=A0AAI9AFQ4_9BACT|nr:hypothetical protein [Caminibacter mediatlanticus]EDM22823.1 hypothetical protein CMTB2_09241 [Caminibacter mediatlanticus TB-2]
MILKLPYSYGDFKESVFLLIDKSRNLHVIWSEPDGYHIEGRGIFPQEENIKFVKKKEWGLILSIDNTFIYPIAEMEDDLYISKNKKFVFDIFNNEIYYIEENNSCFTNYLTIKKISLDDFLLFNEDNLFTSDVDDVEEKIIDDTLIVKFQKLK